MRVLLLTHGTRGDVQPFLALAAALESTGHAVRTAGPAGSAPLAAARGIAYHPVDDGPLTLMGDPELGGVMRTGLRGPHGAAQAVRLVRRITPLMHRVCEDMADAAEEGADAVVHLVGTPGHHIAERLGAVAVPVALQPSRVPTGAFPPPGVPLPRWMPGALNRTAYRFAGLALRGRRKVHERFRRERPGLGPSCISACPGRVRPRAVRTRPSRCRVRPSAGHPR
ncbi:glycosyltransferase [Nocardiopsis potens]|uniref:glycosyltransferase n=1 Tax=Nocardiopsis potens TaxID=1246458 RepID=UPI000346B1A5|nr:glycosyltransferase [Nocardiopsis potens]